MEAGSGQGLHQYQLCLQKWVPGLGEGPRGSGLGDLPVQDAGSWAHSQQPQKHSARSTEWPGTDPGLSRLLLVRKVDFPMCLAGPVASLWGQCVLSPLCHISHTSSLPLLVSRILVWLWIVKSHFNAFLKRLEKEDRKKEKKKEREREGRGGGKARGLREEREEVKQDTPTARHR